MTKGKRLSGLAAAALLAALPAAAQNGPSVETGVAAWQAGRYEEAVRNWQPLAERGDADAQFNLGHAYRLGRGVTQSMAQAERLYEQAARAGHREAQAMYGVVLFQNGRRAEAMPYIRQGAEADDPRAQYVYGTALFNGDLVAQDYVRAWAMMRRSAAQGLAPAQSQLTQMEPHLSAAQRAQGDQLANQIAANAPTRRVDTAEAAPPPAPRPARQTPPPPPAQAAPPAPRQAPPVAQPAPRRSAPAGLAAPGGRWRIQLGAFSSEANARSAWSSVASRLPGLQPHYVRAGNVVRLQAGPLASRDAAARACTAARQACFPVAP